MDPSRIFKHKFPPISMQLYLYMGSLGFSWRMQCTEPFHDAAKEHAICTSRIPVCRCFMHLSLMHRSMHNLCIVSQNQIDTRPRGPMDKASAYGAGDSRFESWRGHIVQEYQFHCLRSLCFLDRCMLHGQLFQQLPSCRHNVLKQVHSHNHLTTDNPLFQPTFTTQHAASIRNQKHNMKHQQPLTTENTDTTDDDDTDDMDTDDDENTDDNNSHDDTNDDTNDDTD